VQLALLGFFIFSDPKNDELFTIHKLGDWDDLSSKNTTNGLVFGFLILFSWLALLTHVRLSESLRAFNEVVTSSAKGMAPFLIIVLVAFFAQQDFFYYKNYVSTNGEPDKEYFWYLAQNFRIFWLGDLTDPVDDYDWLEFIIFGFFTIAIIIVLMNLLISIIGDSHENVMASI